MVDPTAAALAKLNESVETLSRGLSAMLEVQAKHGAALERIEAAMAEEPGDGPSPVAELLTQMVSQLTGQTAILLRIEAAASGAAAVQPDDAPSH